MNDPVSFLKQQWNDLADGGMLVINVPDCTDNILCGDISIAMHEHINYFDKASLDATCTQAGFQVLAIERAGYGGALYCVARKVHNTAPLSHERSFSKFEKFKSDSDIICRKFADYIHSSSNGIIGYYAPLRILPYLSSCNIQHRYRFFDDTPTWHNGYFDGVNVRIENRNDLFASPTDHIFVSSITFGTAISNMLKTNGYAGTITCLSDLI